MVKKQQIFTIPNLLSLLRLLLIARRYDRD